MIRGEVNSYLEPIIELQLRSPNGALIQINGAIDTGFSDHLTLPPEIIHTLGLPFVETIDMVVADNSLVEMRLYEVDVIWDGHPRTVYVQESEAHPLVGMKLVAG